MYNNNLKLFLKQLRNADEDDHSINMQDRMCNKRGKSRGLCNAKDVYEVASDVSKIIDNINRQAENEEEILNALRCSVGRCGKDDIDYKLKNTEIDDSAEDNPNMEGEIHDDDSNQNLLQAVLKEINEISSGNGKNNTVLGKHSRVVIPLTPEDMANYYRSAVDDVRKALMDYVRYRSNFKTMRGLPRAVRRGVQNIREKYRHFKITDKALAKHIFDLLLTDMKKIRIIPDKDTRNLYDVYLPVWMYMETLNKKEGRRLRSSKRILPLTLHQKNRMQNKEPPRKLLKYAWRRNLNPDQAKYGVPFVLDIQGLGQIN
ncbi:uncharacterized protein LOC123701786 [Colias croceus]|uniref:uncharacterized protein LOC123701786 n=1 Tax=Colias crocea TaxID=72248 RepID=UPI001E27B3E6|nr:uncharacterized protein LOC123701786 [Colias croceus]